MKKKNQAIVNIEFLAAVYLKNKTFLKTVSDPDKIIRDATEVVVELRKERDKWKQMARGFADFIRVRFPKDFEHSDCKCENCTINKNLDKWMAGEK